MKRITTVLVAVSFVFAVGIMGCSQKPQSANSSEAIEQAKTLQSVEEQAKFLGKEANAFINSEQFDEAIKTAKYVLSKLDKESQEAKSLIERAKQELETMAREKAEEAKAKLKEKLGGIGQ